MTSFYHSSSTFTLDILCTAKNLPRKMRLSRDGHELTLIDLCKNCGFHRSDLQVIQCNASNVHGYDFAQGYINVLGIIGRYWQCLSLVARTIITSAIRQLQPINNNLVVVVAQQQQYTVSHKKRATLFLIITLVFLGRFLQAYLLHQWKDEGILYTGVNKIYHFTLTVSPHYLVKLKRHINSTF